MENAFIIFDRDGTLIEHVPYLNNIEFIKFKPDLIPSLQKLQNHGFKFGIVSNQSAIGRGLATINEVLQINTTIGNYLKKNQIDIQFCWFCPHLPSDNCHCRKPRIGLGLKAEFEFNLCPKKSYVVGDSESDILFGKNLGCKTVYINSGNDSVGESYATRELILAADWIIRDYRSEI